MDFVAGNLNKLQKSSLEGKINWSLNVFTLGLSFFLSVSTTATYIFNAPTCTGTIITLKSGALNAEFQHFILRVNKISLLCGYHSKRGLGVKADPKRRWRQGDFRDNSYYYFWGLNFAPVLQEKKSPVLQLGADQHCRCTSTKLYPHQFCLRKFCSDNRTQSCPLQHGSPKPQNKGTKEIKFPCRLLAGICNIQC